jgi:hypothetical protein
VAILEIYNEQIRDLLEMDAGQKLEVRQGEHGMTVPGLTMVPVDSLDSVMSQAGPCLRSRACGGGRCWTSCAMQTPIAPRQ